MNELQVNITRLWALAQSIETIISTNGGRNHQILLQVTNEGTGEETFIGLPISKTLSEGNSDNFKYAAFNIGGLIPQNNYILCPNLVDIEGRVWAEGHCQEVSTEDNNEDDEGWTSTYITLAVVILLSGTCLLAWYLSKRGFKRGFNLN